MVVDPNDTPVLGADERIVWQGGPKPGIWFEPADVFAIPFSLLWLGAVTFAFVIASSGKPAQADPIAFVILPIFVCIGLYIAFGRFLVARHMRERTRYFLTNRRAIIREGIFRRSERSINLAATEEVRIGAIRNGFATIEFGGSNPFYRVMPRSWAVGQSGLLSPAFEKIADAEQVYRRILDTQRTSIRTNG